MKNQKGVANHIHFFKVALSDVNFVIYVKNQTKIISDISMLYRKSLMVATHVGFNYAMNFNTTNEKKTTKKQDFMSSVNMLIREAKKIEWIFTVAGFYKSTSVKSISGAADKTVYIDTFTYTINKKKR